MGSEYLCHLTFTLSKFTLKNFIFLEIVSDTMVSPSIFFHIFIKKASAKYLCLIPCLNTSFAI